MKDLRPIIAKNICDLRIDRGITQQNLADTLNYSDKAVSKWERAEALPDVTVLKQIADYFGVSVDYLLEAEHKNGMGCSKQIAALRRRNRVIITLIAVAAAWFLATVAFAVFVSVEIAFAPWLVYVYAIPVSAIVAVIFNSLWGIRKLNFLLVSILIWGLILSVYLTARFFAYNPWVLFIVGIPAQFIITFFPGIGLFRYRLRKDV